VVAGCILLASALWPDVGIAADGVVEVGGADGTGGRADSSRFPSPTLRIDPVAELEYLGAFRLPAGTRHGTSWAFGGKGFTYVPTGDPDGPVDGHPGSLMGIGHDYQTFVEEVSIPTPIVSPTKDFHDLPVSRVIQPFADVTEGRLTHGLTGFVLGDVQWLPPLGAQISDKLYWVRYEYYLPDYGAYTFGWSESGFANLSSAGLWRIDGEAAAATSQYLTVIPTGWADMHVGGRYLAAGRARIVMDGSWGPALYAIAPWNHGNPPPNGTDLDGVKLLYYDSSHPVSYQDPNVDAGVRFSHSDEFNDVVWVEAARKSAVVFSGIEAALDATEIGGSEYYGEPDADGCGSKGYHGEPYTATLYFYDSDELAAVVYGTLQAWEPQPYARFSIEHLLYLTGCRRDYLQGMAYDPVRNFLYVAEPGVDDSGSVYEPVPIVHVFQVGGPLFADGFESGGLSAWSLAVP